MQANRLADFAKVNVKCQVSFAVHYCPKRTSFDQGDSPLHRWIKELDEIRADSETVFLRDPVNLHRLMKTERNRLFQKHMSTAAQGCECLLIMESRRSRNVHHIRSRGLQQFVQRGIDA